MQLFPYSRVALYGALMTVTLGCASQLQFSPTVFSPSRAAGDRWIVVKQDVVVTPSSGYTRMIKNQSRWRYLGSIPEGEVYKIYNDVFMLEGAHMHEAHSVLAGDKLVGFYLPVERAFAPLPSPVPISVNRE